MNNMTPLVSILRTALRDLRDTIDDLGEASFQSSVSVLQRFVYQLDEEPLAGFLNSMLPVPDFDEWYASAQNTIGSELGSGILTWPPNRPERVAMQIALCRGISNSSVELFDFFSGFMYSGRDLNGQVRDFSSKLLEPLVRDITRLTELRPLSPVLFEAMGALPPSGDHILDALLQDACKKFKDAAPKSRTEGTEKLWDAWERLKSIEVQVNKRMSVARLLEQCSPEPAFRAVLDTEARALTEIGNAFHIRHFETDTISISMPEHNDYLFHRLFALIHLLLFSRGRIQYVD